VSNSSGPDFATARANLRDTVKWLVAALAALAATALGTSPLTGLGSLLGGRLNGAIAAGLVGLMCVFAVVYIAFGLLSPAPFFLNDVLGDKALMTFIEAHAADLLPPEFDTVVSLLDERGKALEVLRNTASLSEVHNADRIVAQQVVAAIGPFTDQILDLAYYQRLRRNLKKTGPFILVLAFIGSIAFGTFAWAVNPAKATADPISVRLLPP
jgi:hypothetical protein